MASAAISASSAAATKVLMTWDAIKIRQRLKRSAINPVKKDRAGLGRLLKTSTSPS